MAPATALLALVALSAAVAATATDGATANATILPGADASKDLDLPAEFLFPTNTSEPTLMATQWLHAQFLQGTIMEKDPFVSAMMGVGVKPSSGSYSVWAYVGMSLFFSTTFFVSFGSLVSVFSWEWRDFRDNRKELWRQARLSMIGMLIAAPIIGVIMKNLFEQKFGRLRFDYTDITWGETALMSLGFILVSDLTFYTMHSLWHTPFMYKLSHSLHHSCRPTTTYAASAADAAEILLTGFASVFVPALVLPISARLFLFLDLFQHFWSIWIHNHDAVKVGFLVYDPHDHNVHHYYGERNFNYGLFTQIPDRLFGTYRGTIPNSRLSGKPLVRDAQGNVVKPTKSS